jgi:hypothetical protein
VRLPPVKSRNISAIRPLICSTDIAFTRAAASSIASGMPSSRTQSCATAGALWLVTANDGTAAMARSMNSRTASYWERLSTVDGSWRGSGSEREGSR